MIKINQINIGKLPFKLFNEKNIIIHDIPVVIKYTNKKNEIYVKRLIDSDNKLNRFLLFKVHKSELYCYENQLISIDKLLFFGSEIYLIDSDFLGNFKSVHPIDYNQIPDIYLPDDYNFIFTDEF